MSTVTRAASRRMVLLRTRPSGRMRCAIAATSGAELLPHEGARSAPITTPRRGCGQGLALVAASSPMTRQ